MDFIKIGFLSSLLFAITGCTQQKEEHKVEKIVDSFSEVKSQTAEQRSIKDRGLVKLYEVNVSKDFDLFQPYLLNYLDGRIILFDSSPEQMNFVLFDSTLAIKDKFGGFGRGPGEYLNILNLTIDEKKKSILAIDDRNAKMETWSWEGELIKDQKISNNIYRLIVYKDSFIVHDPRNPEDFLYLQDQQFSDRKSIAEIMTSIDHPAKRSFVLSGEIVADTASNSVFYSGWGNSYIKGFELSGHKIFSYNSIEPIEYYLPTKSNNGALKRDENKRPASRDIEIYGDYLVTLYTGETRYADQILDFYNKNSGIYEYSIKLDYKTTEISNLSKERIFYTLSLVNGDWLIVKYQLKI